MKKAFMLFVVLVSLIVETSCSNSSNPETPIVEKSLTLTSNKTEVEIGEEVDFIIKVDHEVVNDATLFVNNEKISNPFILKQAGTYTVIAKKEGYNNSNSITIQVNNLQGAQKKMVLSAERTIFYEGEIIKFTVKDNSDQEISNASIKLDGLEVGSSWLAQTAGNYTFIASKEGYEASQSLPIEVRVSEFEISSPNYFIYKDKRYDISKAKFKYIGEKVTNEGIYDRYRLEFDNGLNTPNNVLQFNVEFKQPESVGIQVRPQNGKYTISPFEPFKLTTWSNPNLDTHTDKDSYVDLTNIYRISTTNYYIDIIKDGKIDFTIWTRDFNGKPKEKIFGTYRGEIIVDALK